MTHPSVLISVALACMSACHHAPAPKPPPQIVVAKRPVCNLPELPGAIGPVIGWANPDQIVVSKSDMVGILQYVQALRDWIEAARPCLDGTFADDLNHFLGAP